MTRGSEAPSEDAAAGGEEEEEAEADSAGQGVTREEMPMR